MNVSYNLVLFHVPGRQAISDFLTVRSIMIGRAPDIEVYVVSAGKQIPDGFWKKTAALPTLLFSPMPIDLPQGIRGTRLIQEGVTKFDEVQLVSGANLPTPETFIIEPETRIDEGRWGPFTIVKPNYGFRGSGIRLMRTRDVRWIDTSALPKNDPRSGRTLLAQRYVDTGPFVASYRVMTVLGRPIYCRISQALERRPDLDASQPVDVAVASNNVARTVAVVDEPEVVKLAMSVHAALPRFPVMGIDIVREYSTGQLFVLEFNSHGSTWHLSSEHGRKHQREFGLDYYRQFNALDSITDALIEATRKNAV
jgi:hypothetical protein